MLFPHLENCQSVAFSLVNSYIWGPVREISLIGFKYFINLVDDCSHMNLICLMKNCSELL